MSTPSPLPANRIGRAIDRISGAIGRAVSWLALAMVLLGALNAIARYFGKAFGVSLSSNSYIEGQWYLFSAMFLLSGAWVLQRDGHVRVDVLSTRLSVRGRALVEIGGGLLLMLPFCLGVVITAWPMVLRSWQVREGSPDPGGLARYPVKSLIVIAFVLLALQGAVEVARAWGRYRAGKSQLR